MNKDNVYSETIVHCSVCGKDEHLHWNLKYNKELHDYQMCFTCNHWRSHYVENLDRSLRINGQHYLDCGRVQNPNAFGVGMGGREIKIRKFDGTIITTNNLWHQGTISKAWRDKLPDNAEFETMKDKV